jgi:hypothetical protein
LQKREKMVYDGAMPRKTLALIVGLVLVTAILFMIAVQTGTRQAGQQPGQTEDQTQAQTSPTPDVAHTTLSLQPNPVEVGNGRQTSVGVEIDTSDNNVTAVQLELTYDPKMLSNVKVTPGVLFPNATVLIDDNDTKTGKYTYAFGIQPNQKTVSGQGTVAKITFTARGAVGTQSELILDTNQDKPTLVTARAVAGSVLKEARGTTVVIIAPTPAGQTGATPGDSL